MKTSPRFWLSEARDYPATFVLCAIWTAVFAAMVVREVAENGPISWSRLLVTGVGSGRGFGDLSVLDVARGEVWRLITCNFVHFSILHLALNLTAMYQLGTLLESWYGSGQLLAIYLFTGGVGNLIGVAIRWGLGMDPRVHSGGGSVVLLGFVGVCAVVGWRSRGKIGIGLFRQMMILIGLTALIGGVFFRAIDNWGHLGGVVSGSVLGVSHGWLLRRYGRPGAWGSGVLATLIMTAGGAAQVASDVRDRPLREQRRLARRLVEHERLEQSLVIAWSLLKQGADASGLAAVLERDRALGPTSHPALGELQGLMKDSAKRKLSDLELKRFEELAEPVIKESKRESLRIRGSLWKTERGNRSR